MYTNRRKGKGAVSIDSLKTISLTMTYFNPPKCLPLKYNAGECDLILSKVLSALKEIQTMRNLLDEIIGYPMDIKMPVYIVFTLIKIFFPQILEIFKIP